MISSTRQMGARSYRRSFNFALVALCCLFLLPACDTDPGYSSGKELRGVIVNADTGEPIPDAIVVAEWITSTGTMGGGEVVCFHVGSAVTNSAGEYFIPAWRKKSPFRAKSDWDVIIFAHKTGYQWPNHDSTTDYPTDRLVLSRDSVSERLDYLQEVDRQTDCFNAGATAGELLPLRKALLDEARGVAQSASDPRVKFLLERVDELEASHD